MDPKESSLTSEERLHRQRGVDPSRIANLIVIGASAGGHRVLAEVIKDFAAETLKEIDVFGYAEGSYAYVLFTRAYLSIRINK